MRPVFVVVWEVPDQPPVWLRHGFVPVHDRAQVHEPRAHPDVRDVGAPHLVGAVHRQPPAPGREAQARKRRRGGLPRPPRIMSTAADGRAGYGVPIAAADAGGPAEPEGEVPTEGWSCAGRATAGSAGVATAAACPARVAAARYDRAPPQPSPGRRRADARGPVQGARSSARGAGPSRRGPTAPWRRQCSPAGRSARRALVGGSGEQHGEGLAGGGRIACGEGVRDPCRRVKWTWQKREHVICVGGARQCMTPGSRRGTAWSPPSRRYPGYGGRPGTAGAGPPAPKGRLYGADLRPAGNGNLSVKSAAMARGRWCGPWPQAPSRPRAAREDTRLYSRPDPTGR